MKKRFIIELILVVPDLYKKMRMEVDALDYVTREVLLMEYDDERWKLVAYFSKLLNETKHNYKIYNREMLTVIRRLEV